MIQALFCGQRKPAIIELSLRRPLAIYANDAIFSARILEMIENLGIELETTSLG